MAPITGKNHPSKHGTRKQPDDEEQTNVRRRMHWAIAALRPLAEQVFAPEEFVASTSSARGYVFLDEDSEEAEASRRLQKELARRRVQTFGDAEREYEDMKQPDEPRAFLEWQCHTLEGIIQQDLQRDRPAFAAPGFAASQQPQTYLSPPFMMPSTSARMTQFPYLNVNPASSIPSNFAPHNNVQGLQQGVWDAPAGVEGQQLLPPSQAPRYGILPFHALQLPSGTFVWHECCQGYFFAQYDDTGIPLIYLTKARLDGVRGCWGEADETEIARRGMPREPVRSITFFPDGTGPELQRASMFTPSFYPRHPRQLLDMPDSGPARPKKKRRARAADEVHPESLPTKKVRFAEVSGDVNGNLSGSITGQVKSQGRPREHLNTTTATPSPDQATTKCENSRPATASDGNAVSPDEYVVDPHKIRIQRLSLFPPEQAEGPDVDGEVFVDSHWRFWPRSCMRATVKKTGKEFELGGVPHSAFLASDQTVRVDVEKMTPQETRTCVVS